MQAIILAGGLGTRLRPFTVTIPKPLLPLGETPILEVLLRKLPGEGFRRIRISVGYLAPLFQGVFGDGSRFGLSVEYLIEEKPLGTAGVLASLDDLPDDFLVLNGDTLTDVSLGGLFHAHVASGAHATIYSHEVEEIVNYGVLEFDPNTRLLSAYVEKPRRRYFVSTGIYALSKRILDYAEPDENGRLDMPDLLRRAIENGKPVRCDTQDGAYWRDIGRFDHYEAASSDFQKDPDRFFGLPNRRAATTPMEPIRDAVRDTAAGPRGAAKAATSR
jgi:NDP-sugar pyrophosphorylase family protein